jgi:hypothetical protein
MNTKLFTTEQVKKFFGVLDRLSGGYPIDTTNYPWKNYQTVYTKDSDHIPSTREVFVHRTVNKWLKGKFLIIYKESDLNITYKQFVSITSLSYKNNWGQGYIDVGIMDYANVYSSSLFGGLKVEHNDALDLEGEWCNDCSLHTELLKMTSMQNVPDKEYTFKAYDLSKPLTKEGIYAETTITIIGKTVKEAYKEKNKFESIINGNNPKLTITGDIINIREIENNNNGTDNSSSM